MKIIHGGIKTITVDVVGAAALPVASNRENQRGFYWDDSNTDFERRTALKADLSGSDTLEVEGLWEGLGGREGVRGCVRKIGLYCDASINSRPENLLGVTMLSFHPFLVETSLFFPLNKEEFWTSFDTEGLLIELLIC